MKLIVQIPCYNEEATLARTIADIPRAVPGIDSVEVLVVDDGSRDRTVEVARAAGADHVVRHRRNRGLAAAFRSGVDAALRLGADVVVNTDADNQYFGADIPALVAPIVAGEADIVVGNRETAKVAHFSPGKKALQWLGSAVVRRLSGTAVPDAVSGFRALSREAALRLNIVSSFSYTIEMLIQAGQARLAVLAVPVRTRPTSRRSRLFRSVPEFLKRSTSTIGRTYALYHPLRVFATAGFVVGVAGLVPIGRFLWFWANGGGGGHLQSLVLGGVLVVLGVVLASMGLMGELIAVNRQLLEVVLEKTRALEADMLARRAPEGDAAQPPAGLAGGAPVTPVRSGRAAS